MGAESHLSFLNAALDGGYHLEALPSPYKSQPPQKFHRCYLHSALRYRYKCNIYFNYFVDLNFIVGSTESGLSCNSYSACILLESLSTLSFIFLCSESIRTLEEFVSDVAHIFECTVQCL